MPQPQILCKFFLWFVLSIFLPLCYAQPATPSPGVHLSLPKIIPAEQAFTLDIKHEDDTLIAQWHIDACCYLYQNQLHLTLHGPSSEKISLIKEPLPAAQVINDPYFGPQFIYKESLKIEAPLKKILATLVHHTLQLEVEYQGCAHSGFCYPPQSRWFEIKVLNHHIQSILPLTQAPSLEAPPQTVTSQLSTVQSGHFFTTIATFYLLGLLLTFTPCVLPMIPILCSVIVGQHHLNTRKAFWLSLSYVLSMAFTYALIGIVAALVGKNLQAIMQKPEIIIAFAALFVFLGFVQLGKIHLSPFRSVKQWLHHYHIRLESGSYVGAILMGILATLIASPCVTAPLIGGLSYISQTGDILLGGTALLAMGLGIGTFLLIMGTVGGKYLPKTGPWMHAINQTFAIVMFGLSIWLLSRVFTGSWLLILWAALCVYAAKCMGTFKYKTNIIGRLGILFVLYAGLLIWGVFLGETDPLKPLAFNPWHDHVKEKTIAAQFTQIDSLPALSQIQQEAKNQGEPLLLVFYADWCISCKHLEHELFANHHVEALQGWKLVRADVTRYNHANQTLLQKFDLMGPPAILFFDKKGIELTKLRVVGETSRQQFIKDLDLAYQEMNRK